MTCECLTPNWGGQVKEPTVPGILTIDFTFTFDLGSVTSNLTWLEASILGAARECTFPL